VPIIQGTIHNRKEFTGKEFDNDGATISGDDGMNLYYFGARFYDPEICRWITVDPEEQFFDAYAYAGNGFNPINAKDTSGGVIGCIAIGAGVGVVSIAKAAGLATLTTAAIVTTAVAVKDIIAFARKRLTKSKKKSKVDPYARPGQKKQYRERKEKKRGKGDWKPRKPPKPPKKHTPSKKHRKKQKKPKKTTKTTKTPEKLEKKD